MPYDACFGRMFWTQYILDDAYFWDKLRLCTGLGTDGACFWGRWRVEKFVSVSAAFKLNMLHEESKMLEKSTNRLYAFINILWNISLYWPFLLVLLTLPFMLCVDVSVPPEFPPKLDLSGRQLWASLTSPWFLCTIVPVLAGTMLVEVWVAKNRISRAENYYEVHISL